MARFGQARDEQARRFGLVAQHGMHGVLARAAVEQHQRHVAPAEFGHLFVRQAGGHDGAIDLVLPHIAQDLADVRFALEGKQQKTLALAGDLLAQVGQYLRIVQIGQVGNDDSHQVRAPRDQAAGGRVGDVVEADGRLHDFGVGGWRDAGARLEAARHGRLRHAGQQGHVIRGHAPSGAGYEAGGAGCPGYSILFSHSGLASNLSQSIPAGPAACGGLGGKNEHSAKDCRMARLPS
ncbi:hypothetical protein D3C72_1517450 [compost metagenome]